MLLRRILVIAMAAGVPIGGMGAAHAQAIAQPDNNGVRSVRADHVLGWHPLSINRSHAAIKSTSNSNGATSIITIADKSAPDSYDFALDLPAGSVLQADGAGGFDLIPASPGAGADPLGHLDAPWARDANGKSLPTHFTVNGSILTQHVDLTGAAFPVTADPHYTWGWVTGTIYFNKSETALIGLGGFVVTWLPSPATLWGGRTLAALAAYAASHHQCLKWKILAIGVVVGQPMFYSGGYCQ